VAVGVEGDAGFGVAQALGHVRDRLPAGDEPGGVGVPQVVEADVWHPGAGDDPGVRTDHVGRVERHPGAGGEHQVVIDPDRASGEAGGVLARPVGL